MISAITNRGFVRFSFFEGTTDTDRFIVILKGLIQDAQRTVLLIIDNPHVHRANRVREWAAENTEKIELFYLPPYAPNLNPDEYLNLDLKTAIRSGPTAKTAAAPLEKARTCMERIAAAGSSAVAFQP
jgi:transposase